MSKLLEVKEFDLITDNIGFRNNVKYKYLNNKKFKNANNDINKRLNEYLSVCKENSIQAKKTKNKLLLFPIIKVINGRVIPIKTPPNGKLFPIKIKIKDIIITVILHLLLYSYTYFIF